MLLCFIVDQKLGVYAFIIIDDITAVVKQQDMSFVYQYLLL